MSDDVSRDERGRFPKGVSGNPEGRPPGRGRSLSQLKRTFINEVDPDDPEGRTRGEVLLEALYSGAKAGDRQAARDLLDRVDGKPRQSITLTLDQRTRLEQMLDGFMESEAADGRTHTRDEAIEILRRFEPLISELEH